MNTDQYKEIGYTLRGQFLAETMSMASSGEDQKGKDKVYRKFKIANAIRDLPSSIYSTVDYDLVMKEINR